MADHGSFYWNELSTQDVTKARAFYKTVVGWTWREMDMGEGRSYTILQSGDKDLGGMVKGQPGAPSGWQTYIAVDDIDAAIAKVAKAGGKVTVPAFDVPGIGRIAFIADPTGATIALMTVAAE